MEAVAAGDDVAREHVLGAFVREADARTLALEIVDGDVGDLEHERKVRVQAEVDEVLHDLRLSVDDDRPPAREVAQRDPVAFALELQLDAVVDDPLALQPLPRAGVDEEVGDRLLEHTRSQALLDVLLAAVLEHDRLDALAVQEVREGETSRPGADDADLRAHQSEPVGPTSSRTR